MRLYYAPGSCALSVHIVLCELDVPYELELVPMANGRSQHAGLRALNDRGKVPTLMLDEGSVLTESTAILRYLAQAFPGAALWPTDLREVAVADMWLSLLSSEVHPAFSCVLHPERFADSDAARREVVTRGRMRVEELFTVIDARLADPWVLGSYSACDALLAVFVAWAIHIKVPLSTHPRLGAWAARMLRRPALRRAFAEEGLPLA